MNVAQAAVPVDPVEAELAALARECRGLAVRLAQLTLKTARTPMPVGEPFLAGQVRRYLRARRLREQLLPADLFADPAWDMLLDLYASELEETPVSISSACIAAAVPPTTALRWLGRLQEIGLIERTDDLNDCRRSFVCLTHAARESITRWLSQASFLAKPEEGLNAPT